MGALPGPTEVAPTFSGIKGALLAETMPKPVTTGANSDPTILHWDSTGLTNGLTGELRCHQHARFNMVETQTLGCRLGLPRYLTDFLVTPVDSQLFSTS